MKYVQYLLLVLSLVISNPIQAKSPNHVKKALKSAVKVIVPESGTGSGFAIHYNKKKNRTLIMTNDHVCQGTRGKTAILGTVDYTTPINTNKIYIKTPKGKVYKGWIVKTSNLELAIDRTKVSDLCLVSIKGKIPITRFQTKAEIGDKVFSIGNPKGYFPLIHEGYFGGVQKSEGHAPYRLATLNISFGSSGSAVWNIETGKVVGVAFAIFSTDKGNGIAIVALVVPSYQAIDFLLTYLGDKDEKKAKKKSK